MFAKLWSKHSMFFPFFSVFIGCLNLLFICPLQTIVICTVHGIFFSFFVVWTNVHSIFNILSFDACEEMSNGVIEFAIGFLNSNIEIKQSNSLSFKPFKPLANYSSTLERIEHLLSVKDYETAMILSQNLRSLGLKGLHYFQTYDWLMLMTVVTLGYIGWMVSLLLHVLQSYTSLMGHLFRNHLDARQRSDKGKVMSKSA